MQKLKSLDEWDIKLIKCLKSEKQPKLEDLRRIWCERCGIAYTEIYDFFILKHFIELIFNLKLCNDFKWFEMICHAHDPWWNFLTNQKTWLNNWLSAAASVLMLANVKDLPGYK